MVRGCRICGVAELGKGVDVSIRAAAEEAELVSP